MLGIAFDLGRPAHVALDEQTGRDAAQRHRGGEEERLAGDDLLRSPHIGHDLFGRLARARAEAGQRQRSAHQLQEFAAAGLVVFPLRRLPREFAEQEILESFRFGKLFQALPILRPLRARKLGANSGEIEMFWLLHQR